MRRYHPVAFFLFFLSILLVFMVPVSNPNRLMILALFSLALASYLIAPGARKARALTEVLKKIANGMLRIKLSVFSPAMPTEEVLKKIANEMGGEFIKDELRIHEQIGGWPIFINMRIRHGIIIQMSAPYVKKDNFRFSITESGVKSNDESKVHSLLANSRIRELIDTHISSRAIFDIANNALQFSASNMEYVDVTQLRSLLELFAETLAQLCQTGSAYEVIPSKRSGNLMASRYVTAREPLEAIIEEPDQNSKKEELRKMIFEQHAQRAEKATRDLDKTPMGLKILGGFFVLPIFLIPYIGFLPFSLIQLLASKIRMNYEPRPVIQVQTDEILQIANHLRKPDIRYVALPTELTIDRAKGSVKLAWYGGREEILDFSEIRAVVLGTEGSWSEIIEGHSGYTIYSIHLGLNDRIPNRILIAKERKEKVAELLAATIAQFLNVGVVRFMRKTKPPM